MIDFSSPPARGASARTASTEVTQQARGMDAKRSTPAEPPSAACAQLLRGLARCGRMAQRAMEAQLGERLSIQLASMLWACRELAAADVSQLDLAKYLGISPAQASGLVESLRREGLLVCERSARDRRRQTWQLTPAGQQLAGELDERLAAWSRACRAAVGDQTLDKLARGMSALEQFLEMPVARGAAAPTPDPHRRRAA
jgi:DNA-binding MarR family transcriptional regulator